MKLALDRISINGRHRRDLGDVEALATSIEQVGLLHPVVVTRDHRLIAGERRIAAAQKLGWKEIDARVAENIGDALTMLTAERDENTCRKDFAPSEAVAVGEALEALEKPKAQERKREGGRAGGKACGKLPQASKGKTRDMVGAVVGMSGKTYEKAKSVVEAAKQNPEKFTPVKEQMDRTGNVNAAVRELKRDQIKAKLDDVSTRKAKQLQGVYDVLVIDPPWMMEKIERDCRENQVSDADEPNRTTALEIRQPHLDIGRHADLDRPAAILLDEVRKALGALVRLLCLVVEPRQFLKFLQRVEPNAYNPLPFDETASLPIPDGSVADVEPSRCLNLRDVVRLGPRRGRAERGRGGGRGACHRRTSFPFGTGTDF